MDILTDFMDGEAAFQGFSEGTMVIFLALIGLSIVLGVLSRRYLFPRLMNLFSKNERIELVAFLPAGEGTIPFSLLY